MRRHCSLNRGELRSVNSIAEQASDEGVPAVGFVQLKGLRAMASEPAP